MKLRVVIDDTGRSMLMLMVMVTAKAADGAAVLSRAHRCSSVADFGQP